MQYLVYRGFSIRRNQKYISILNTTFHPSYYPLNCILYIYQISCLLTIAIDDNFFFCYYVLDKCRNQRSPIQSFIDLLAFSIYRSKPYNGTTNTVYVMI